MAQTVPKCLVLSFVRLLGFCSFSVHRPLSPLPYRCHPKGIWSASPFCSSMPTVHWALCQKFGKVFWHGFHLDSQFSPQSLASGLPSAGSATSTSSTGNNDLCAAKRSRLPGTSSTVERKLCVVSPVFGLKPSLVDWMNHGNAHTSKKNHLYYWSSHALYNSLHGLAYILQVPCTLAKSFIEH